MHSDESLEVILLKKVRLGRTGLMVTQTAFGALPVQRIPVSEAAALLRYAFDQGVNFFDTARGYSDSEEKLGAALADVRSEVVIATKSFAKKEEQLLRDVEASLAKLKTDYIDILQFHNPGFIPKPGGADGLYDGIRKLQDQGVVRHIGITNHKGSLAEEAVESGLYATLQFPLSYLSSAADFALVDLCRQHDVGFIAMKALSGGLITDAAASFAYLRQYDNVVPIWGIQRRQELDEFLALEVDPPTLDHGMLQRIAADREDLSGSFCRGCGYCMPCPVDIPISMAARMSLLLQRAPYQQFLSEQWQENMQRILDCIDCGQCRRACPYELDTPQLLRDEYNRYWDFAEQHGVPRP